MDAWDWSLSLLQYDRTIDGSYVLGRRIYSEKSTYETEILTTKRRGEKAVI